MNKLPSMVKYSLFLSVLLIIAGGLLVAVNSFTAPIIDQIRQDRIAQVLEQDFPYNQYEEVTRRYSGYSSNVTNIYFAGDAQGNLLAVIYQVRGNGYGGVVYSLVGFDVSNHTLIDVVVVDVSKETPGIGSRVVGHDFGVSGVASSRFSYARHATIVAGVTVTSDAVGVGMDAAADHYNTIKDQLANVKVGG